MLFPKELSFQTHAVPTVFQVALHEVLLVSQTRWPALLAAGSSPRCFDTDNAQALDACVNASWTEPHHPPSFNFVSKISLIPAEIHPTSYLPCLMRQIQMTENKAGVEKDKSKEQVCRLGMSVVRIGIWQQMANTLQIFHLYPTLLFLPDHAARFLWSISPLQSQLLSP